jgi:hypothetical protein
MHCSIKPLRHYYRVLLLLTINHLCMNRPTFFLSITTGILAIAALAATKAHKFVTRDTGYYSVNRGPCSISCNELFYTAQISMSKQAQCLNGALLFDYSIAGCSTPLFTKRGTD